MLLTSMPRENWDQARSGMALELLADCYRALRDRRHPAATLQGFAEGLASRSSALEQRKRQLGRRRVGERFVLAAFSESEAEMASHCSWQRVLSSLTVR